MKKVSHLPLITANRFTSLFKPAKYFAFLICIFLLYSGSSYAQTGVLKGLIKDEAGNPLAFASLMLQSTKINTSSNDKGFYQIESLPQGKYTVIVELMGYTIVSQSFTLKPGEIKELDFELKPKTREMDEVLITGVRSANGMGRLEEVKDGIIYSGKKNEVLVLDSMDANTAQNNPRQVLGRVPGANYSETEGSGFPSNGIGFRGLNPSQSIETNTRQNGYNITADLYGYPEAYYLPPLEAVERIEIIRGASSLQFGPQFGGVINYIIKQAPKDKPFEFNTEQTGGSYGLFNSFNSIGGTIKKWSYYSYLQYKTQDGWRPNSEVKQLLGFAKIEFKPNYKFRIGLEYSMLRNRIHMPGGLSDEQYNKDSRASFRARNWLNSPWNVLALIAQYDFSKNTSLFLKSAGNFSERNLVWRNEDGGPQTPDSVSPVTNTYVPREVEHEGFKSLTNELRLLTKYKIQGIEQSLAVGGRYFIGSMKRQGGGPGSADTDFDLNLYGGDFEYNLDFTTTNIAPFIENTFHLGKYLSIIPGFRYEYIRSTAKGYITDDTLIVKVDRAKSRYIPLGGIGLQLQTSGTTNIYANISQAYRPTDYSNQTPIGIASKIDPNLKDANGYNADLGYRGTWSNFLNFDVGAFYLAYNNRIGIISLTDASGNTYTYRTNVANSVHQGLESYIEVNPFKMLNLHSRIGEISFFNSFAFINAKYVSGEFKGNRVEFAPNFINRFGITYRMKKYSTTFLLSNTSKTYGDANNTDFSPDATVGLIPAYRVLDWSNSIKVRRYNIKFGINNISNSKYFTKRTDEYPGPGIIPSIGRSFYIGLGARF